MLQQNLQTLPRIFRILLCWLIGITGATYSYHIREKRPGSAEPILQHSPNIILYIDYVVELRLEVIFMAPRIAIGAGKLTAVVWIYAVTTPEPAIYEPVFIKDSLKVFPDVFNHALASPGYYLLIAPALLSFLRFFICSSLW